MSPEDRPIPYELTEKALTLDERFSFSREEWDAVKVLLGSIDPSSAGPLQVTFWSAESEGRDE
ncbi:hypothetical protein [Streptomyces sp. URMC 129]|uniref:hypothetical protein n=1 Tax=Streptomyces sp. URMC 129 TaxID=3423407 RepID=UPI003F1DB8B5